MASKLLELHPALLIGFRDALSHSLNISVTFADEYGKELEIESSRIGRKYVQSICRAFHFNKEEYHETWKLCKRWDEEAAKAILQSKRVPHECWCKYACFAVPVKVSNAIEGIILCGERRIINQYSNAELEKTRQEANKQILKCISATSNSKKRQEEILKDYNNLFTESTQYGLITKNHLQFCKQVVEKFAEVLGEFIDEKIFRSNGTNRNNLNESIKILQKHFHKQPKLLLKLLAVFFKGFPSAINSWLEILDPAALSPEMVGYRKISGFVVCIDIRNFTVLCGDHNIEIVQKIKQDFFRDVIDIVHLQYGIVDTIFGDTVTIHFDNRESLRSQASRMVECVIQISNIEKKIENDRIILQFGIGISYGNFLLIHDYIESKKRRLEIGIFGTVVNKASRLCNLAKKFGAIDQYIIPPKIVFDKSTSQELEGLKQRGFEIVPLQPVRLKGYDRHELVYTLYKKKATNKNYTGHIHKERINLACGTLGSPSNRVIDAMTDYYSNMRMGKESTWQEVAVKIEKILNCHHDRISFRANTSTAIANALYICKDILALDKKAKSPKVLMSKSEHPTSIVIAETLFGKANIRNFEIEELQANFINLTDWFKQWNDCHILLFPHITWGRGTVLNFRKIAEAWKKSGPDKYVIIDGAHTLGHIDIKLEIDNNPDIPFDFFATCGHKWLGGPQGTGILYTAQHILDGHGQGNLIKLLDSFTVHQKTEQSPTGQRPLAAGLYEACDEFLGIGPNGENSENWRSHLKATYEYITSLTEYLRKKLNAKKLKNTISIIKPLEDSPPTGITALGITTKYLKKYLKRQGVIDVYKSIRDKLNENGYSVTLINLKTFKALRICTSYNINKRDIDGFVETLSKILNMD